MKVYLDACCLGRLTDDQAQPRVRDEAGAIERILGLIAQRSVEWIASEVLSEEIRRHPSPDRRIENETLVEMASGRFALDERTDQRSRQLHRLGYGVFDAMHLASAESAKVDVLLTTDDRFIRRAARRIGHPQVPVRNPVSWIQDWLNLLGKVERQP